MEKPLEVPNPWINFKFKENDENILKCDEACIIKLKKRIDELKENKPNQKRILTPEELQARYKEEELHLELYPEPFIGNPGAPIYLLNLNPGYDTNNKEEIKYLEKYIEKNYTHNIDKEDYPFYYLRDDLCKQKLKDTDKFDEKSRLEGSKWWRKKFTREVRKEIKDKDIYKQISKNVFCIEYFPYHSISADGEKISKCFESDVSNTYQGYNKYWG